MIKPHGGTLINKELPRIEKERLMGEIDEFEKMLEHILSNLIEYEEEHK